MTIPTQIRRLFWGLLTMLSLMASAQAVLPYQDGDLILAVRGAGDPGNRSSFEVNIGSAIQFTSGAAGPRTIDLSLVNNGSIVADLVELFGPDWATRADVLWSVTGVQKFEDTLPANTMFISAPEATVGVQSTPWPRLSGFQSGAPALKVQHMGDPGFRAGTTTYQTISTNSSKGLKQTSLATNSYASFLPGGANTTGATAFGVFGGLGIEANFGSGTASAVVDLYKLEPGDGASVLVGAFRLSDSGVLTFSTDVTDFVGPAQVKFDTDAYSLPENGGTVPVKITRAGNTNSAFTLFFSTTDGTAIAGTDYIGQTNTVVSFANGETSKTVNVAITDRPNYQGGRSFTANIALATGVAQIDTPSTATVTIGETSPQPSEIALSAATYSASEDVAAGVIPVTVNRAGTTTTAVTATLTTTDGTALAGTDYTSVTTPIDFAVGESTKVVNITIANRAEFQGDRNFTVTLSNPTNGATLGTPAAATVTIVEVDQNPAGQIAFSAGSYSFGAADTIVVTLSRTLGSTGAVSAQVALAGGTLDAADLGAVFPATVNFADGATTQTLSFPLASGAGPLPGAFNLTLSNPGGGAVLGARTMTTVNVAASGVPDLILPKLKVTSPKAGKSAATVDVTGTVTDLDAVARVEVRLNSGVVQTATLGTLDGGARAFALNGLAAENGKNTLLVQAFDVKGTASKVTKVSFTYTNVREALAGTYNGLATPTVAAPPAGNLNNASGLLTLTVSKTGVFSGKLKIAGTSLAFGGIVANDGTALFKPAYGNALALATKGKAPIAFGNLALAVTVGKATGVLGTVATIDADRAFFDGKTPATTVLADYYVENKGKFTVVIPAMDQPVLTHGEFPQGDGFANVTVTKQGKLSLVGTLADGTPVSATVPLSQDYKAPLFAQLYAKKGSLAGVVTLDKSLVNSDLSGADFLWLRPLQSTAKNYVAGWPGGVKVDVLGAIYKIPAKAEGKSVFPALLAVNEQTGNAALTIDALANPLNLNIAPTNKVTTVPTTDKSYKVAIASPTGKVTGSFTNPADQTKPALKGIVYQKGPEKGAFGFFLTVVPRGGAPGTSGGFTIFAKP
jgi:hypothetical protein